MEKNDKKINFDFGKKTEEVVVNPAESEKLDDAKQTETPADSAELTDNASSDAEDTREIAKATGNKKAVVTYVGNGVWRDAKGNSWARVDRPGTDILATRSYAEAEYNEREDLKFMVKYGEMKITLV